MVFGKKCVLVTNGNLPSMLALADWLMLYGHQIEKIYVTYRLPSSKNNIVGALSILRSSGASYLWLKLLLNSVVPLRLRRKGLPYSVESFTKLLSLDIPVEKVDSVKSPEFLEKLKDLQPKSLVSFSATQRFPVEMLNIFPDGAVNVHYGALPRFAGLSPYFWHLYEQEESFGVTLHRIEKTLDAGGVVDQKINPIEPSKDCLGLLLRMAGQVSPLLNALFSGETNLNMITPQDLKYRSYYGHPGRIQVREFVGRGFHMASKNSISELMETVHKKFDIARSNS